MKTLTIFGCIGLLFLIGNQNSGSYPFPPPEASLSNIVTAVSMSPTNRPIRKSIRGSMPEPTLILIDVDNASSTLGPRPTTFGDNPSDNYRIFFLWYKYYKQHLSQRYHNSATTNKNTYPDDFTHQLL